MKEAAEPGTVEIWPDRISNPQARGDVEADAPTSPVNSWVSLGGCFGNSTEDGTNLLVLSRAQRAVLLSERLGLEKSEADGRHSLERDGPISGINP